MKLGSVVLIRPQPSDLNENAVEPLLKILAPVVDLLALIVVVGIYPHLLHLGVELLAAELAGVAQRRQRLGQGSEFLAGPEVRQPAQ